jgi:hypothetical protein
MTVRSLPPSLPVLAIVAACAIGCGAPHPLAPVSGRVTLDGKPLANASVTFQPVVGGSNNPGPGSGGFTDADGRYTLKVVGLESRGAVVGKHTVHITLVPPETDPTDDKPKKLKQLPAKYSGKGGKLEFDVPAGGTDHADFALTSK